MYKIARTLTDLLHDELSEGLGDWSQEFVDELKTQLDQGIPGGPKSNTGDLSISLTCETKTEAEGVTSVISTTCPYAPILELGTHRSPPKPFLAPSFQSAKESLRDKIKACVNQALAEVHHE